MDPPKTTPMRNHVFHLHLMTALCMFLLALPLAAQKADPPHAVPGRMGWAPFTVNEKHELNLTDDQLVRLRDMDDKLAKDYNALGLEPWNNPDFPALNDKRNKAVQDILSPEQYKRWATPNTPMPKTPPTILPKDTAQPAR
jgi:hypothetical protein